MHLYVFEHNHIQQLLYDRLEKSLQKFNFLYA